jgi:hypothetical protein
MKRAITMIKMLLGAGLVLLVPFTLAGQAGAQGACISPPAGLVSWWPGDGNATEIVGGNDGTLQGGAAFTPGLVGQAFSFDGVDDYVLVPDAAALDLISGITIDAWINPAAVQDDGAGIVAKGAGTQEAYGLDIVGNICPRFFFRDASLNAYQHGPGCVLTPGVWTHVAATYDAATGALKFYVNGVEMNPGANSAPANTLIRTNDHELSIGSRQSGSAAYDLNFRGLIDEVEIYNRALTAAEIAAIFNAGSAGKCKDTAMEIEIDIKPGSFPNSINPNSKGKIPVAILTDDSFDATTVDPNTVLFGATGTEASPVQSAFEDVDGDGDTDMILHFNTQDTGIVCGDTSASLTGETLGGQMIEGSDSVNTVGCK